MYTGISSGPNARCRVWEAFTFTFSSETSNTKTPHAVYCKDQQVSAVAIIVIIVLLFSHSSPSVAVDRASSRRPFRLVRWQ